MQALRQEVHGLALPRCLEKSREHFVAGMDAQLEDIVAFIRGPVCLHHGQNAPHERKLRGVRQQGICLPCEQLRDWAGRVGCP